MFDNITSAAESAKIGTAVVGGAIAAGIVVGIVRKSGFWGTFGFAVGFGVAGFAISSVIGSLNQKV